MNRKSPISRVIQATLIALPLVFCAYTLQAASEVGPDYFLFKEVRFTQTDVGTSSLATNPYRIEVHVLAASNGSITDGTVSLPAGSSATSPKSLFAANDGTGAYGFSQKFPDQATLDSNFADGTYSFQITGASSATYAASLSLTGGVYPSATPLVTNTTWSGGNLNVDPSASFTLNWTGFTGGTASDRIVLTLQDTAKQTVFFQLLPASATSQTFAVNFFQPNQDYKAVILFLKVTTTDTTDISGSTGFAAYSQSTDFTIQTVPEPSTWAMLMVAAGLLLGAQRLRGRRS